MRQGRCIGDRQDLQPILLKCPYGSLATRARALDKDVNLAQTHVVRHLPCIFGAHLGCVGRILPRATESITPRGAPRKDVAIQIGDRNDHVVEGRLDVCLAVRFGNDFLLSFLLSGLGHDYR